MTARAGLAADEVIELGQGEPARAPAATELEQVRSVVDAWVARYGKETAGLVARQSRLAREAPEAVWAAWLREAGAAPGAAPSAPEVWEATRLVAFKLLSEGQRFAQQHGRFFTDDQDRLLSMEVDQALRAIDTAEGAARALRPELLPDVDRLVRAATHVLADVAAQLGRVLEGAGLAALAAPEPARGLARWLRDNAGLVALVAVGALVAAVAVPAAAQALAPRRAA